MSNPDPMREVFDTLISEQCAAYRMCAMRLAGLTSKISHLQDEQEKEIENLRDLLGTLGDTVERAKEKLRLGPSWSCALDTGKLVCSEPPLSKATEGEESKG